MVGFFFLSLPNTNIMSTVNAYSAWLNGKNTVSVLCGVESDSLSAFSMGLPTKLTRTVIQSFAPEVFEKSFGIPASDLQSTDAKNPMRFSDIGLNPVNLESIYNRPLRIQIIETSDFSVAVANRIINEKDANGAYVVRDNAYKLDRETKQRVLDSNGNFVYRKCFLQPDLPKFADMLMTDVKTPVATLASITEHQPEDVNVDDVPF